MLFLIDCFFVALAINSVELNGPNMMIMFGFEVFSLYNSFFQFLLLLITASTISLKYVINIIDGRQNSRWEHKGLYILYLEFMTDLSRLIVFTTFFFILLSQFGLPLHIIRQLWITFNSVRSKTFELLRYRRAMATLPTRFAEATPEELQNAETCIVCRDALTTGRRLPCGHILHMECLRGWLERSQQCPLCRESVFIEDRPRNRMQPNNNNNNRQQQQQQQQQPNQPQLPQVQFPFVNFQNPQPFGAAPNVPVPPLFPAARAPNGTTSPRNTPLTERQQQSIMDPTSEEILTRLGALQEQVGQIHDELTFLNQMAAVYFQNVSLKPTTTTNPNPQPPTVPTTPVITTTTTSEEKVPTNPIPEEPKTPSSPSLNSSSSSTNDEQEELRRKRLLRFSKPEEKPQ